MSGIVNDALNSFNNNTALTATQSFASGITSGTTITGNGGLNVISVTGNINLGNGENLTLSGTSSDIFVINVSGTLTLTGNAKLLISGVPVENVIYNFTGSSGTINTGVGDVLNGVFLAPNYSMTLDGIWNGEIISGKTIQLLSGVTVNGPSPVPEPATLLLLGTGLAAVGAWSRKELSRRQAVETPSALDCGS